MRIILSALLLIVIAGCSHEPVFCNRGPLWCYRSLAGSDCYAQRVEGWDSRLIARETNAAYNAPVNCEHIKETKEKDAPPEDYDDTLDRASTVAKIGGILLFIYSVASIL
jgi:hypothetical protein